MELFERSRQSLYHATSPDKAISILDQNTIHPKTQQVLNVQDDVKNWKSVNGVSLTRSWEMATTWSSVTFEFDQDLLRTRFKFMPFNYFYRGVGEYNSSQRHEAEEFLIGPLTNMDRYLKYMWMSQWEVDNLYRAMGTKGYFYSSYNNKIIEKNDVENAIFNHKKFRIRSANKVEKNSPVNHYLYDDDLVS